MVQVVEAAPSDGVALQSAIAAPLADAARFIELLTGSATTKVWFRLIHDRNKEAVAEKRFGRLGDLAAEIAEYQRLGYGVFVVVNEGGNSKEQIKRIRAVFVDADEVELPAT